MMWTNRPAYVFIGVVSWYDLSEGKLGNDQSPQIVTKIHGNLI